MTALNRKPREDDDKLFPFDFDNFPSIEIDSDRWGKLDLKGRLEYLKSQFFDSKSIEDRMKMVRWLVESTGRIGEAILKDKEIAGWFTIMRQVPQFMGISATLNRLVKVKHNWVALKNDRIAKLMGFDNGSFVTEVKLDLMARMVDPFLELSGYEQKSYGLNNVSIDTGDKSAKETASENTQPPGSEAVAQKTYTIIAEYQGVKIGIILKVNGLSGQSSSIDAHLYHPTTGLGMSPATLLSDISDIFYKAFFKKIDLNRNYIKLLGSDIEVCPRREYEDIVVRNLPYEDILLSARHALENSRYRHEIFLGEAGSGKTVCAHKIANEFPDRPFFLVSTDCISSVAAIRRTFKMFHMFKNSIVFFDDYDAAPVHDKHEISAELYMQMDRTNSPDLTGFFMSAINNPEAIDMSMLNRPGRIDRTHNAANPASAEEIRDIITYRAASHDFIIADEDDDMDEIAKSYDPDLGEKYLLVDFGGKEFSEFVSKVCDAAHGITHTHVAEIFSSAEVYADIPGIVTISDLKKGLDIRIESIRNTHLSNRRGRLVMDSTFDHKEQPHESVEA